MKGLIYEGKSFLPEFSIEVFEIIPISTGIIRDNFNLYIVLFIVALILYFFGIGKYFTAIFVFVCYEILQKLNPIILNGGDNLMKFLLLYMIFIDSYQYFSFTSKKYKRKINKSFSNFLSNIAAFSICLHVCFAYFISGWHKVHADVWFNGVATYYTLSLERFKGTSFNDVLVKNGVFVTLTTYFTMLVEIYYPVLIWFRKTKKVISLFAISLHIGIYIFMMIYDFQVVFIMVQGFFFSNEQWVVLINKFKAKIGILNRIKKWTLIK